MPYNIPLFKTNLTSKLKEIGYDMNAQTTTDMIQANCDEVERSDAGASFMSIPVYTEQEIIYIPLEVI